MPNPATHAEWRLCRKLDADATVWVARVHKSGEFALARPCRTCMKKLLDSHVAKVYYTITSSEFGTITF